MEILISNDPSLPCLLCLSIERRAYLAPGGGFSYLLTLSVLSCRVWRCDDKVFDEEPSVRSGQFASFTLVQHRPASVPPPQPSPALSSFIPPPRTSHRQSQDFD
jgi:hypothetical protein